MSIKAAGNKPVQSNQVRELETSLRTMGSDGLSLEEERSLKDAFKALSADDRKAAVSMVRQSGYANLAAQLSLPAGTAGRGEGVSATDGGRPSGTGPLTAENWKNPGPEILGRLTQNAPPGTPGAESGPSRCGPANLLAGAIMSGPDATAGVLTRAAGARGSALSDGDRARLKEIAGHVKEKKSSLEELGEAQGLLYRAGNTGMQLREAVERADGKVTPADRKEFDQLKARMLSPAGLQDGEASRMGRIIERATGLPTKVVVDEQDQWSVKITPEHVKAGAAGAFSDTELTRLARDTGTLARGAVKDLGPVYDAETSRDATLSNLVDKLGNGQSATFRVAAAPGQSEAHHYISVGRDASGKPWVYNPDPARGDHVYYEGVPGRVQPGDFLEQLQRYNDRNVDPGTGRAPVITLKAP